MSEQIWFPDPIFTVRVRIPGNEISWQTDASIERSMRASWLVADHDRIGGAAVVGQLVLSSAALNIAGLVGVRTAGLVARDHPSRDAGVKAEAIRSGVISHSRRLEPRYRRHPARALHQRHVGGDTAVLEQLHLVAGLRRAFEDPG